MANIKDFIKKIGNSAVSLEEQQQALAQVEKTIIEAKQKRTEVVGKNADMVIQALKTIEAKLEAKLTELNNTPAKQGIQGPVGRDGKDGKDGKAGRDGLNGKDGTDGKDGVDGKDGISVVDAKIDFDGSLVVYLSNGSEIDCGQILSPDVAQNIIINSGGSGTSQTVTDTLVSLQNQINTLTGMDGVLGDMAQQNANAVAITGGTINGTTIGATTPSSIVGTTITGQTGVLRGTGNNLLLQSNTFNTTWTTVSSTIATTVATTDPFGGSNAWILTPTSSGATGLTQTSSNLTGIYTLSLYAKAGTASWLRLFANTSASDFFAWFNLSTGVLGTVGSGVVATITSIGNGWYRCTVSSLSNNSIGIRIADANNSTSGINGQFIYIYGSQLEVGNTANTYIPTTTTAVYGTPTLSFSGVSTLGLESNGALFLQPAGTGAIQAQATTSTTAGGNVRGTNAVDWQTLRGAASQVASGFGSVTLGGASNAATSSYSSVLAGNQNVASNSFSVVCGGVVNTASGERSFVGGGTSNTSAGYFNTISGGYLNSGTSGSAVTTQSGTMNATTAVTLSGSNANIKVGQYITGTSIATHTYVAAISGTSLTLSQAASGSSTSTLSFFTPHGVVVGGGNNQATGAYSAILGGGDAGTAANRNVASGDWSVVCGGTRHTASGLGSFIGGGGTFAPFGTFPHTASGVCASIVGGFQNTASGQGSFVGGGYLNTANAQFSAIMGGEAGTTRSIVGNHVFPACSEPISIAVGVSQAALLVLAVQTTDATATALRSNASAAGTTNQVILPNNSAYLFKATVISGVTGGGNTSGWKLEGVIKRGANAASTAIVGSVTTTLLAQDAGASGWVIAATADTTNGGLRITFTGQASTTIRTVAKVETTEVTF